MSKVLHTSEEKREDSYDSPMESNSARREESSTKDDTGRPPARGTAATNGDSELARLKDPKRSHGKRLQKQLSSRAPLNDMFSPKTAMKPKSNAEDCENAKDPRQRTHSGVDLVPRSTEYNEATAVRNGTALEESRTREESAFPGAYRVGGDNGRGDSQKLHVDTNESRHVFLSTTTDSTHQDYLISATLVEEKDEEEEDQAEQLSTAHVEHPPPHELVAKVVPLEPVWYTRRLVQVAILVSILVLVGVVIGLIVGLVINNSPSGPQPPPPPPPRPPQTQRPTPSPTPKPRPPPRP